LVSRLERAHVGPPERLELTEEEVTTWKLAASSFRDTSTGDLYRVEIAKTEVVFTRQQAE
jgi:hypothetical protein